MKFAKAKNSALDLNVAPVRERGLKYFIVEFIIITRWTVAPVRERGLKYAVIFVTTLFHVVAPVRERGLKSASEIGINCNQLSLP